MKIKKWRELEINPKEIPFKNFKIKDIVSYPYAGNDVIEAEIILNSGELVNSVIKIQRSKMSDFAQENETINKLSSIYNKVASIYEYGIYKNKKYIALEYRKGIRLSEFINNENIDKDSYLYKYGAELANIHTLDINTKNIAFQRVINEIPIKYEKEIEKYIEYLENNNIDKKMETFIHGDFHYANILFDKEELTTVLDWEYSGIGFREQDIAWACVLRSSQEFMNSIKDIKSFLNGYKSKLDFNINSFIWCYINGTCHFYLMNKKNKEYQNKLIELMDIVLKELY